MTKKEQWQRVDEETKLAVKKIALGFGQPKAVEVKSVKTDEIIFKQGDII